MIDAIQVRSLRRYAQGALEDILPIDGPIVLFITGLNQGGAETQLVRLAIGLSRLDWDVRLLTLIPPTQFVDELASANIPVHALGAQRGRPKPGALIDLLRYLREVKPVVILTFLFHANLLGRVAGRIADIPVVTSIRSERFGPAWRERALGWTDRWAYCTVTNASLAADRLVRNDIVAADRMRVIPNGLDIDAIRSRLVNRERVRNELNVREHQFLWLAVGRLEPQKDFATAVRAIGRLVPNHPSVRLVIAGDGRSKPELIKTIQGQGLERNVELLGLRNDVPDLMAAADGFVLSSAYEGLPNVVLEAMAAALPIVATHVGGVPDLLSHGQTGLLVPPGDAKALSNAMREFMEMTPPQRSAISERALEAVLGSFSIGAAVTQWADLLRRAAGK